MTDFILENTNSTMQRYAAEIYRLQQDHEEVSISLLAETMELSVQAISRMVKRMQEEQFVAHVPYKGVQLTDLGQQIAMPALRRHRLCEVFLVNVMGYDWAAAHFLTDTFELGVNDELEDRIDELTGHPTACPHGEPIPTRDGHITYPDDICLIDAGSQIDCEVTRVRTHDLDHLRYIAEIGLVPGQTIHVMGCGPFQGPLRIQMNGFDQVVGHKLASVIWVVPNK